MTDIVDAHFGSGRGFRNPTASRSRSLQPHRSCRKCESNPKYTTPWRDDLVAADPSLVRHRLDVVVPRGAFESTGRRIVQ